MSGSDWPACTLAASYAQVLGTADALTVGAGGSERAEILAATATRGDELRAEAFPRCYAR